MLVLTSFSAPQRTSAHQLVYVARISRRWLRVASQTLLRLTLPPGTQTQYDWVHPSTEQPQGVGVRALPRHDYMRVNLSKNSKLSLKKKKRLHSALPWAYVNSSHSQTSRNVWGGKLFPSSEACLALSLMAPTCSDCAPGPGYHLPSRHVWALPWKRTIPLHLHSSRHGVLTTTKRQASQTELLYF